MTRHASRCATAALLGAALLGCATPAVVGVPPAADVPMVGVPPAADVPPADVPPAADVPPPRVLDPRVATFLTAVDANRQALAIPGLSLAIVEDGEILEALGVGEADVERRRAATDGTPYPIASITKTFTAVIALQLVEQGRLDLDAPVQRWVPQVGSEHVRVRHLLSHTSHGVPGEQFRYDPERFEHLKTILEAVGGKPLREQMVDAILDPLALHDTVPGADVVRTANRWSTLGAANLARWRDVLQRVARPYTLVGDGDVLPTSMPPDDFWASAGVVSTVRDLARFDIALDAGELLRPETLRRAWTPLRDAAGRPLMFGTGWYVTDYRGTKLVWHFGHWGTGFSALLLKIPEERVTLVMLANSEALADHHFAMGEDVTHNVFACSFVTAFVPAAAAGTAVPDAALPAPPRRGPDGRTVLSQAPSPGCARTSRLALERWRADRRDKARPVVPLDAGLAADVVGRWQFPGRVVTFFASDGRLWADFPQGVVSEVFASAPDELFVKVRPYAFRPVRENGEVVRLDVVADGEVVHVAPRRPPFVEPVPGSVFADVLANGAAPGELRSIAWNHWEFDYATPMRRAMSAERDGLVELFEFGGRAELTGANAATHGRVLAALAEQWGDDVFAAALADASPWAVSAAKKYLGYVGADAALLPKTFAVPGLR